MIPIFLLTIILTSLEPIVSGSVLLGWSAAVGVMRRDGWGVGTVVLAGVLRDVVLVSRLGASSTVFVAAWLVSAFASLRFEHPFVVTSLVSAISIIALGIVTDSGVTGIGVVMTVSTACITILLWRMLQERQSGIRLRTQ